MKRLYTGAAVILSILFLAGCAARDSAPSITVVPGDGFVTVTWDSTSGTSYTLYRATTSGASFDPDNCPSVSGCLSRTNVSSPYVMSGLVNGINYSFLLTASTNGNSAGSPSPVVSAVPRIAGSLWIPNTSTNANALRGVAQNGNVFVAVGDSGALFSSTVNAAGWTTWDTWANVTNPLPAVNLNAVTFGGVYLAAGAGGTILLSSDAATWAAQTSGTTNDLLALASNGNSRYVAVGTAGTIVYSDGGNTWLKATSPTSNTLYGVTYGGNLFVAVGAQGTVLTSSDGATWSSVTSNTPQDLRGVAYGASNLGAGTFVAIGAAGALITSADVGATWTLQAPIGTGNTLNAVTFGKQFVAVGDAAAIFTSEDGLTWTHQVSTPAITDNLYAVKNFTNSYSGIGYAAVGATGRNLSAN